MPAVTVSVEFPESLQRQILAHAPEGPAGERLPDATYLTAWLRAAVGLHIAAAVGDQTLAMFLMNDFIMVNSHGRGGVLITTPGTPGDEGAVS